MNDNLTCHKCKKKFKSKKSQTLHITKQICISKSERTYCPACNYTAPNKNEYKKHLISIEHLNNISNIKTSNLNEIKNKNKMSFIDFDPYLSEQDKHEIKTDDIENITISHKNNSMTKLNVGEAIKTIEKENIKLQKKAEIKKLEEMAKIEKQKLEEENKKYINGIHYIEEPENKMNYDEILKAELYSLPPKTDYQNKILNFLINIKDKDNNFKADKFKQILKLIKLNEANYLTSHIRRSELNINDKQIYMGIIDKFILELVKLLNAGYKTISGIDIEKYILKISK